MKKKILLIALPIVAVLLVATLLVVLLGGNTPETPDAGDTTTTTTTTTIADVTDSTTDEVEDTTTSAEDPTTTTEGTATEGTTTKTEGTTTTTTTTTTGKPTPPTTGANDNSIDWGDAWGDSDPTGSDDPAESITTITTTTATTTTTTTTTTAAKPTTIDKVALPAVGTDVDGRGRIKVSQISLADGVMSISIRNYTDEQKNQWITEETNYVNYKCYDKDGKLLTNPDDEIFGYLYLGCLEVGEEVTFSVELPKGTAEVKLTDASIVYWTPWS